MKQYIFTPDQLAYWLPILDEAGIAYDQFIKDGNTVLELAQEDALRIGIEKPPRPLSDLKRFGIGLLVLLGIAVALAIGAFLFSGCGVPYKKLAQTCAELYPPNESVSVRDSIIYDTLYFPDYQFQFIDTTDCPPNLTDTLKVIKTVTKKVEIFVPVEIPAKEKIVTVRDSALANVNTNLRKEVEKYKLRAASAAGFKWAFWILLAVALSYIGYRLFSKK